MPSEAGTVMDLRGLTILEIGAGAAAAFAGTMLADFGARVIVCEPRGGTPLRTLVAEPLREAHWAVAARNKLSVAIDPAHPEAEPVLRTLAAAADAVLSDGPDARGGAWRQAFAARERPPLCIDLPPPGADRPSDWGWGIAPEFGGVAAGIMALTGWPGGAPVLAEFPLADRCAGLLAATCALAELRAAQMQNRDPAPIEIGTHEALMRMNEWQVPVAASRGVPELRNGNRFPMNSNIGNVFRTRDGKLLTVSAATPSVADRLLAMVGGETLRDDPRFATPAARMSNMDELDALIAAWMARHDAEEAMRLVREHDVVVGPIQDADDILANAHIAARGNVVHLAGAGGTVWSMPAALPRIEGVHGGIRRPGPSPGADTDAVLRAAGLALAEIGDLRRSGAIWA